MDSEINSHILKLTGKCELPSEVAIGHNYHVSLKGSIISCTESDNEDGTLNRTYAFKPVTGEILTDDGEMLKLKDNRSNSTLIRQLVYKKWVNAASNAEFETYYDLVCRAIMQHMDDLIEQSEHLT